MVVRAGRGETSSTSRRWRSLGERSEPFFRERRDLLLSWLPNAEPFELPGATHLLQVENPRGLAEALAAFFARHPIATGD